MAAGAVSTKIMDFSRKLLEQDKGRKKRQPSGDTFLACVS